MSLSLHAANVLVSMVGTVTADGVSGGASSAIGGLLSLKEVALGLSRKRATWADEIATRIDSAFDTAHLTETDRKLIRQMIEQAQEVSPTEVMAVGQNPDRLCAVMVAGLRDPALTGAAIKARFTEIVAPILRMVMASPETMAALQPAFQEAALSALGLIAAQVEALTAQMRDTAETLGERTALVRDLARRYAPGSEGSFDSARLGLEQALEAAKRIIDRGTLPSNLDAAVQEVLAEVARLIAAQDLDGAARVAAQERSRLLDEIAERQQAMATVLDTEIDLARARNLPEEAADHLLARLRLEGANNLFRAAMLEQDSWYARGRETEWMFDLEVSAHLAEKTILIAQTRIEHWEVLNALGNALAAMGSRQTNTSSYVKAIDSYRLASDQIGRTERPLCWALSQHNLGNALQELGHRENSIERLAEAVTAYRMALNERPRETYPLDWAVTQNSLGNALQDLGIREQGTVRLAEAETAYRLSLEIVSRSDAHLWAMIQNNLGIVLTNLGIREHAVARFVAALRAYQKALSKRPREQMPFDWAQTMENIAYCELELFEFTTDSKLVRQAKDRLMEAREVYRTASPFHFNKCADALDYAQSLLNDLRR